MEDVARTERSRVDKKTGDRKIDKGNRTGIFPMLAIVENMTVYVKCEQRHEETLFYFYFFFFLFVSISLTIQRNKLKFNLSSMSGRETGQVVAIVNRREFALDAVLGKKIKEKRNVKKIGSTRWSITRSVGRYPKIGQRPRTQIAYIGV